MSITFYIEKKEQQDLKSQQQPEKFGEVITELDAQKLVNNINIPADLFELILDQHRNKKSVQNILIKHLKEHDVDYIKRNIVYANKNLKDQRKYRAYLDKAINNDWGLGSQEDLQQEKQQQLEDERKKLDEAVKKKIEQDLIDAQTKQADEFLAQLSEEETKKIEKNFYDEVIKNDIVLNRYYRKNNNSLDHFLLKNNFLEYITNNFIKN